jgi:hypothetical protein
MVMQTLLDGEAERESRLGLAVKTKAQAQMALQGSSLMSSMTKAELEQQLQQRMQNQYANAAQNACVQGIPPGSWSEATNGSITGRFGAK